VERAKLPPNLAKASDEDFWRFDRSTVMIEDCDKINRLFKARVTSDSKAVAFFAEIALATWSIGVSFRYFCEALTGKTAIR
jgi:hypothetical protein